MLSLSLSALAPVLAAASAYADSGPAVIVGHAATGTQPCVYPAVRIPGWWGSDDDLLICRIPETDLWVVSSDVEGCTTWDALQTLGRPLADVLADQGSRLARNVDVFEEGDEDPQWPDPSAFSDR